MRCRGLRGLGICWRRVVRADPNTKDKENKGRLRKTGRIWAKSAARRYVRFRITGFRRFRDPPSNLQPTPASPTLPIHRSTYSYAPTVFRHLHRSHNLPHLPTPTMNDLLALSLEVQTDFEIWIQELWRDFLLEPTPYLVASAICYLGGLLVFVQYYWIVWWVLCFLGRFVPWDEDLSW